MDRRKRLEASLWGLFIADALAMPAHWFYNRDAIRSQFNGGVSEFVAPPHPHPEAFMVGMGYNPDVATANQLGRPYDILHEHVRFYQTSWSDLQYERTARESEHGNAVAASGDRFHYHHGLPAGSNTLNAHLARVLMRTVNERGAYDPDSFLDGFIDFMTTPGRNQDPYTEVYLRRWFENWCGGADPYHSAQMQRDNWSIGSLGGMIRPLLLSMLSPSAYSGIGLAAEHQILTHRSETVASGLAITIPLLFDLLDGTNARDAFESRARDVQAATVHGEELFARYREAQGPGNIPDDEMWAYHMTLESRPLPLEEWLSRGEASVIRKRLGTVCYVEQGLPLMLYIAAHEQYDFERTLQLNVNAGGDNVNRGMPLGMLLGAACGAVPEHWQRQLVDEAELREEIGQFADIALSGFGMTRRFQAPARRMTMPHA